MTAAGDRPTFIPYLHKFRGVAILAIIGAHAWSMFGAFSGLQQSNPGYIRIYAITETLFHGSTLFFALISGLLYSRVLCRQRWPVFFGNKLRNVLAPYAFITLILTVLAWPEIHAYLIANKISYNFLQIYGFQLLSGQAQIHLWYIPVLTILFLSTPVLNALRTPGRGIGLLLLGLMPLLVSRSTYPDLLSVKTVFFFLGAYAMGMYLGDRLEPMHAFIERHAAALWSAFVLLTATNFLLFFWEYVPNAYISLHQSVVYAQKMVLALLLMQALKQAASHAPKLLDTLGTYAFSLYFLHLTFIWQFTELWLKFHPKPGLLEAAGLGLAFYVLSIAFSLWLSMAVHKVLGRHSRLFIGV